MRGAVAMALLMLAGCSSQRAAEAPRQGALPWPYRMRGLVVVLDGQRVFARGEGAPTSAEVGPLSLPPGEHTVQAQAQVSYPGSALGENCQVRFRAARTFEVTRSISTFRVTVHEVEGKWLADFPERLGVQVGIEQDGPPAQPLPPPPPIDEVCAGQTGGAEILCRTEARLGAAQRARDVVLLNCYHDRLTRLRVLTRLADEARQRVVAAGRDEALRDQATMQLRVADEKIAAVGREVELCQGHEFSSLPLDRGLDLLPASYCSGHAPADPDDRAWSVEQNLLPPPVPWHGSR